MTAYHPPSKSVEWATPRALFDELDAEFGPFKVDVCASHQNAKCGTFYAKEQDGLVRPWGTGPCWMNAPFGRGIERWVERAAIYGAAGVTVVALLPARTDTRWFHRFVAPLLKDPSLGEVRFLPDRIRFEIPGAKLERCPFPCMVVVWRRAK